MFRITRGYYYVLWLFLSHCIYVTLLKIRIQATRRFEIRRLELVWNFEQGKSYYVYGKN